MCVLNTVTEFWTIIISFHWSQLFLYAQQFVEFVFKYTAVFHSRLEDQPEAQRHHLFLLSSDSSPAPKSVLWHVWGVKQIFVEKAKRNTPV